MARTDFLEPHACCKKSAAGCWRTSQQSSISSPACHGNLQHELLAQMAPACLRNHAALMIEVATISFIIMACACVSIMDAAWLCNTCRSCLVHACSMTCSQKTDVSVWLSVCRAVGRAQRGHCGQHQPGQDCCAQRAEALHAGTPPQGQGGQKEG